MNVFLYLDLVFQGQTRSGFVLSDGFLLGELIKIINAIDFFLLAEDELRKGKGSFWINPQKFGKLPRLLLNFLNLSTALRFV
jgi:hypothetical protein